jgi:hypothetical protein
MARDLNQRIEEYREAFIETYVQPLMDAMDATESPIEKAVAWAIVMGSEGYASPGYTAADYLPGFGVPGMREEDGAWWVILGDELSLGIQVPVWVGDKNYRLDLVLHRYPRWGPNRAHGVDTYVAVECDGHDFHEKTKAQAARDKKRDRDLQSLGWRVLRFTGSEVFRDPGAVAVEALRSSSEMTEQAARAYLDAQERVRSRQQGEE